MFFQQKCSLYMCGKNACSILTGFIELLVIGFTQKILYGDYIIFRMKEGFSNNIY
ncbi:Uncharacterised protein [Cedecea lapagei]|uniref:Uncharacterized protein n=1 Tax=Cedecea lapagei TaxID=158823 RepID=A0A447V3R5_9ENTR|nr:Uncharacterised protein [Cedecea lapagei]